MEADKLPERPTTKSQVKSFMGLAGWYSHFISHFSTMSAPLTNLTRKNQPNKVLWTEECEKAFQSLRDSLCKNHVLKSCDFEQPFTVQTDASEVGIGAALLQGESDHLLPAAYICRKLLNHKGRYKGVSCHQMGAGLSEILPAGKEVHFGEESPCIVLAAEHEGYQL